jgi:hypothetical protein
MTQADLLSRVAKNSNVLRVGDSMMVSDYGGQEELAETAGLRKRLDQSGTAVADRVNDHQSAPPV